MFSCETCDTFHGSCLIEHLRPSATAFWASFVDQVVTPLISTIFQNNVENYLEIDLVSVKIAKPFKIILRDSIFLRFI